MNSLAIFSVKRVGVFLMMLFAVTLSFGQKEGNIWYFGSNAGIDFKNGDPVALTNGKLNTFEGSAVACDSFGNLVFYTDGSTVYNRDHQIMKNGSGLKGDVSSAQSAIIVPYPGKVNFFFVFTVGVARSSNGLTYSIIDINSDGGQGAVTNIKNIQLYADTHEKLTAVRHSNNRDFWILVQTKASNEYLAYLLSDTGVAKQPVSSKLGNESEGWYTLKASPQGNKIATTGATDGAITVFDFDGYTGQFSNAIRLPLEGGETYGVEFSPNGKVLYGTNYVNPIVLYQWDLTIGNEAKIRNSRITLSTYTGTNDMGQVQLGPNGKIYIARRYKDYLDCINNPNIVGTGCNYQTAAVSLAGRICGLGLPTFMQSYFNIESLPDTINAGFNTEFIGSSICVGDTIVFSGYVDSLKEVFFRIKGSNYFGTTVKYAFSNAGIYEIQMFYKSYLMDDNEDYRKVTSTIEVFGEQQKILPLDTGFCKHLILGIDSVEFPFVIWQPENLAQHSIAINTTAKRIVYITDKNGCSFKDSINVIQYPAPIADFFSDTVCLGISNTFISTSTISDGNIASYHWKLAGGTILGGATATYQFPNTGLFTVKHIVISDKGCIDTTEKINYAMVRELPVADFSFKKISDSTDAIVYQFNNQSIGADLFYFWNFGSMGSSYVKNPILEFRENIQIMVRLEVEDSFGCVNSIEKQVTVALSNNLYVPNAFSPNGNGLNEIFKPIGLPFAKAFRMEIYNRWGELLFVSEDVQIGWDGTYMGEAVKQDVYLYKITATDYNDELHTDKGTVTLLR